MRRLGRYLLNFATLLLLLTFLAELTGWIWSAVRPVDAYFSKFERVGRMDFSKFIWVEARHGRITVSWLLDEFPAAVGPVRLHGWEADPGLFDTRLGPDLRSSFGPVEWLVDRAYPGGFFLSLSVPFWFLAVVTGAWPIARGVLWMRRGRRGLGGGYCTSCGYDLRATPDRCPECGRLTTCVGAFESSSIR